jgi:tight adherence protein C
MRCGYYRPQAYDNYLAIRNVLLMGTLLTTVVWAIVLSDQPQLTRWVWIAGAVAAVLSFAIPRVYLTLAGDKRVNRIIQGLPDAIDILVMGLSGGLSLQRSLEHTTKELEPIHPPLAQEFQIISSQSIAGSLELAFERFAKRLDEEDLTSMTDTIRIALNMGTPLSEVLRQHADSLRQSRLQRALRKGNLVGLKMLFPTIFCLAPAAFILILSPPLLELRSFRDREGKGSGALNQQQIDASNRPQSAPRRTQ